MKSIVHAGMATMPSRNRTARLAIRSILPQVDALHLYLDGFEELPDYAQHPKIRITRSVDEPGLKANGKLLGMLHSPDDAFYVTVDDDYWYPRNFVKRLVRNYQEVGHPAVFGVHGSIILQPFESYVRDRRVITSWKPLRVRTAVNVVATCGTLHHLSDMRFDVRNWTVNNQVDLHFAEEMRRAGVEGHLVERGWFWLIPLGNNQADSIFASLKRDDQAQSQLARRLFLG